MSPTLPALPALLSLLSAPITRKETKKAHDSGGLCVCFGKTALCISLDNTTQPAWREKRLKIDRRQTHEQANMVGSCTVISVKWRVLGWEHPPLRERERERAFCHVYDKAESSLNKLRASPLAGDDGVSLSCCRSPGALGLPISNNIRSLSMPHLAVTTEYKCTVGGSCK